MTTAQSAHLAAHLELLQVDVESAKRQADRVMLKAFEFLHQAILADQELAEWLYSRTRKAAPAGVKLADAIAHPLKSTKLLAHNPGDNQFVMILVYWKNDAEAVPSCVGLAYERFWHQGWHNDAMRWRQTIIDPKNRVRTASTGYGISGFCDSHWLSLVCEKITSQEIANMILQEKRLRAIEWERTNGFHED
jgi:hypothetical protein